METIHAVFENGVFRPIAPVTLPEHAEVEFEPRLVQSVAAHNNGSSDALAGVYSILSERYESGHADTAARHNEHQP
jgi:predicted DNA-binding antitoxin AbrB/MazE fold protein